jgi:FkbM family methyltransferase
MKILKEKFKDNSNVILEQLAIANDNANVILYSNEAGSGLASLTKRRLEHFAINFSHTEDIKSIKFEDYWKEKLDSKNIDFCKLDIEGHEMDAFIGFGKAINYIDLIQFEFGGCNIDTRIFFQDFWYFFKKKGFDLFRISPLGIIPITNYKESDEYFTTSNYLVKRKIT